MIRNILFIAFLLQAICAQAFVNQTLATERAFEFTSPWLKLFLQAEIGRQSPWYPDGAGTSSANSDVERYKYFDQEMDRLLANKGLLQVSVYKIPVTAVKITSTGEIPLQFVDGLKEGYVKLYVHPSAMNFYADWLKKNALNFDTPELVLAHQTSSMRSMYILPTQAGEEPLIVKSSIPEIIGDHDRRVLEDELFPSVAATAMLRHAQRSKTFPSNSGFLPEPFGFIPREGCNAGEIFRVFPQALLTKHLVPMFALYGDPKEYANTQGLSDIGVEGDPLLVKMLNINQQAGTMYLQEKLIRPFAQIWVQFVFDNGLAPEAHGQNTIVILDKNGMLSGEIYFRDMDGFIAHFEYREKLGIPSLGMKKKYEFEYGVGWFNDTLTSMEYQMIEWMNSGRIKFDKNLEKGILGKILIEELDAASTAFVPELKHTPFSKLREFTHWQADVMEKIASGQISVPVSIIQRHSSFIVSSSDSFSVSKLASIESL